MDPPFRRHVCCGMDVASLQPEALRGEPRDTVLHAPVLYPHPCRQFCSNRGGAPCDPGGRRAMSVHDRVEQIRQHCGELAAEVRRLRKRQRRSHSCPPGLWAAACVVMWLPDGGKEAAREFLLQSLPADRLLGQDLAAKLQAATDGTPQEERLRLTTAPGTPSERRWLRRARLWLQDAGLHDWIQNMNTGKGLAPVSSLVLQVRDKRRGEAGLLPARSPKQKHRLQWLRRWRCRWKIRMGRVGAADRPSPEACARKAPGWDELVGLLGGRRMRLVSVVFPDPGRRLVFRHPEDRFSKKGGRLVAAKRVPQEARCLGPVDGKWPLFLRPDEKTALWRRRPCGPGATSCTTGCPRA